MPHRLVRDYVDLVIEEQTVRIFHATVVATHARSLEPFDRVVDPEHFVGLWRSPAGPVEATEASLAALGRDLADYAPVVGGGAE